MTLNEEELAAIQTLPRDTPYLIAHVSQTQFSVARFAGGCRYNGQEYLYDPTDDTLIRRDVFARVTAARKAAAKAEKERAAAAQGDML